MPPQDANPTPSFGGFGLTLSPGANLISLSLVPDDIGIEAVLTGILDRVETVWQYDTSGAVPRWRSYAPGAPSDLRVMRDGLGYWVLLKDGGDAVLTVTGREETGPARRVARGWNLVGYTSTSPQSPGEYLGALGGSAGTTMVGYAGGVAELVLPRAAPAPADAGAWILAFEGQALSIVREAIDGGVYSRFVFGDAAKRVSLVREIGGEKLGGMYGTAGASAPDNTATADWEASFIAEHGELPVLAYVKETYDATAALALAAQAAGSVAGAATRDHLREIAGPPGQIVPGTPTGVADGLSLLAEG